MMENVCGVSRNLVVSVSSDGRRYESILPTAGGNPAGEVNSLNRTLSRSC